MRLLGTYAAIIQELRFPIFCCLSDEFGLGAIVYMIGYTIQDFTPQGKYSYIQEYVWMLVTWKQSMLGTLDWAGD
jgi:hypothetical protein